METPKLHERISRQLAEASREHGLPPERLEYSLHIFKPDSARLETVVAVDIGLEDAETGITSTLRAFYSPSLFGCASAAQLEKEIQAYLAEISTAAPKSGGK